MEAALPVCRVYKNSPPRSFRFLVSNFNHLQDMFAGRTGFLRSEIFSAVNQRRLIIRPNLNEEYLSLSLLRVSGASINVHIQFSVRCNHNDLYLIIDDHSTRFFSNAHNEWGIVRAIRKADITEQNGFLLNQEVEFGVSINLLPDPTVVSERLTIVPIGPIGTLNLQIRLKDVQDTVDFPLEFGGYDRNLRLVKRGQDPIFCLVLIAENIQVPIDVSHSLTWHHTTHEMIKTSHGLDRFVPLLAEAQVPDNEEMVGASKFTMSFIELTNRGYLQDDVLTVIYECQYYTTIETIRD